MNEEWNVFFKSELQVLKNCIHESEFLMKQEYPAEGIVTEVEIRPL